MEREENININKIIGKMEEGYIYGEAEELATDDDLFFSNAKIHFEEVNVLC